MKKLLCKLMSVVLCLCLVSGMASTAVFAEQKCTDCADDCEFYPTIIIPGLGQSSVCVTDDDGNFLLDSDGKKISAFPAYVELPKVILRVALPLLCSLFLQADIGLSSALADAVEMCFSINGSDLQGQNTGNVRLERLNYSYQQCNDYEKGIINSHIPFNLYPTDLPDDHIYYFCYNSFGNHIDIVNELYDYIEMVKAQTGHSKVNVVPISQGGTIFSALLEYYPQVSDTLHKVLFIVPALDGSTIVGDIFTGNLTFTDAEYFSTASLRKWGFWTKERQELLKLPPEFYPMRC